MVYSIELKKNLLFKMVRLRAIEEMIAARYPEGKMRCPVHLSIGQEAVSIAAGAALEKNDLVLSGHRAHGHYIGKGGNLTRMLAEIYGKSSGCSKGKGGSMHLVDQDVGFIGSTAIVSGTIPVGVGLAYAIKYRRSNQISCLFLGDGAAEEGVFYESVNFAVLKKLPALFICENNLYSVYSPMHVRQPTDRRIHKMVAAMGLDAGFGDGNDVLESFGMISNAVEKIRSGHGPQFLEFSTYRWREHCGPNFDNDIGYRTVEEFEEWKRKDPIPRLIRTLKTDGVDVELEVNRFQEQIKEELEAAFRAAESSDFPAPKEAFDHVFA